MQKTSFPGYALVVLLVGMLLVALHVDAFNSLSVDLAHHYALVFRLFENWQLVPNDPSLGEMNIYPRGSHLAAAAVGMVFGSPFLGLHLVALASLVLLWAGCLAILQAAPNRTGIMGMLALALLLVVNRGEVRIHGAEISGNYFFSQLVAQAMVFVAIAVVIRVETTRNRIWACLFLMGAIYLVTTVHLLPALELLGVFAGALALEVVRPGLQRRERIRTALASAAALAAGIAIVVLHPSFATMRTISEHNGVANLGAMDSLLVIDVVCLVVLASIVPLLRTWYRDPAHHVMCKYVAMYGLALAGLCLLQSVLRYFNIGSDYAVRKYAFGLATFLFLRVAIWAGNVSGAEFVKSPAFARLADDRLVRICVFGVALFVTVSNAARMNRDVDTSDVVAVERQLMQLRDTVLPAAPAGKANLVMDTANMPLMLNYMFSLAVTRTSRELAGQAFLTGRAPAALAPYSVIVSSRSYSRYLGATKCSSIASGPLVMLDPACIAEAQRDANVCKETFDFSRKGHLDVAMLTGFSDPEDGFRWTDAPQASFTCEARQAPRVARVTLAPFVNASHPRQRITITVNGAAALARTLDSPAPQVIELPLPPVAPGQPMVFNIDLPDAATPQSLGLSEDGRRLGVAVTSMTFE